MNPRAREIELLLLTAFSAVPLYFTGAVGIIPLALFHAVLLAMVLRVARGRGADLVPLSVMRALGMAYVVFYFVDAALISRSAIAASTHLVLFISLFQAVDGVEHDNHAQRLLTTALIFVASVATSTDITIVLFVVAFAFEMFRQMMDVSHRATAKSIGHDYAQRPSNRAAAFYLAGATVLGAVMFPLLPRVRNPLVHGVTGALNNATTGLSNSIDFNRDRSSSPDTGVVARIWMGQEAIPFFTPVRLRGAVYDRYQHNSWLQSLFGYRYLNPRDGVFPVARPIGFTRGAHVQQRLARNSRVFLPVGTYAVSGLPTLLEGPAHNSYATSQFAGGIVTFDIAMARETRPVKEPPPRVVPYPVTPAVASLARAMVGTRTDPAQQAAAVEEYMSRRFQYVAHPEQIGHTMTTDEFLLNHRRGHCEYFAAGMVAVMSALNVPARIVGGYYGGRFNPLTGYFVIRNEDAHAWVEVWTGDRWQTYDPTPPTLRPGTARDGLLRAYASALGDSINYFWDRYILTYGLGDQLALFVEAINRMRGAVEATKAVGRAVAARIVVARMAAVVVPAVLLLIFVYLSRRRRQPVFDLLARHLQILGIQVGPAMTMEEALEKLRAEHPEAALQLEPLIALYEEERFSPRRDGTRVRRIRRALSETRTRVSVARP